MELRVGLEPVTSSLVIRAFSFEPDLNTELPRGLQPTLISQVVTRWRVRLRVARDRVGSLGDLIAR